MNDVGRRVLTLETTRSHWFRQGMHDLIEVTDLGYWRVIARDGEVLMEKPWYHPDTMPPHLLKQIRDQYLRTLAAETDRPSIEE